MKSRRAEKNKRIRKKMGEPGMENQEEKRISVLIVEDEGIIARDLENSIKNFGWLVSGIARTGQEALDSARVLKPDVVLMDIKLEGDMDGIEAARWLSGFTDTPVIYLTAFAHEDMLKRARITQPYGYLIKPVEERHLRVTVEMAIYKARIDRGLREKEKWLSMILENLDEGVVAADVKGRIQFINKAAEKHTGWRKEEAVNVPIDQVMAMINVDTGDPINVPFVRTMLDEQTIPIGENSLLKARQPTPITIEGKCVPVFDDRQRISGAMLVFHDISLRKQLEGRLRKAQKMEAIGALAGGIAHDFNNILSVILGYTDLAMVKSSDPEKSRQYIEHVHTASTRARELVKQILSFSRQTDKIIEPIQVGLVLKEELKLIRTMLPGSIHVETSITAMDSYVEIDPTHLHQIIMNLYTNAMHAMQGNGGALGVRLEKENIAEGPDAMEKDLKPGSYVRLSVSDTGGGIDQNYLPRIFEPFFTTREETEGTGIGLSIVRGMVGNYRGNILVDSVKGKGTTFHIYFPESQSAGQSELTAAVPTPRGCERLLFVDDEPAFVELGEDLLGQLGYQVDGFSSSEKAWDQFKVDPETYDAAVLDLVMPHWNGVDLALKLRALRPQLPVILCTGFSGKIDDRMLEKAGIDHVVMKPLVLKEMAIAIRLALGEKVTGASKTGTEATTAMET
jgi:PAS domain S-box-containing protein